MKGVHPFRSGLTAALALWVGAGCFPDYPAVDAGVDATSSDLSDAPDATGDGTGDDSVADSDLSEAHEATTETSADTGELAETEPPEVLAETTADGHIDDGRDGDTAAESETTTDAPDIDEPPDTQTTGETASDISNETLGDISDETANDISDVDADATDDTAEALDTSAPEVELCPGGCAHLDEACRQGVCGDAGCETIDREGECDDALACTTADHCDAGVCVGAPVTCAAKSSCHIVGVCNPATGTCSEPQKPNGAGCDDADRCTEGEACQGGLCVGGAVPDDSGDWFVRTSRVGASQLLVQGEGSLWWFVTLVTGTTELGSSVAGSAVTLTLPPGAVTGIAAVRYDSAGRIARATLLAHSDARVEFLGGPTRHAHVGLDPLGRTRLTVAGTFKGTLSIPGASGPLSTLDVESGAPRAYFVASFIDDGALVQANKIENPDFVDSFDMKNGVPPVIAVGPSGATMIAMPVQSDVEVEIGGLAQFRGPIGSTSTWVVYLSEFGQIIWQRTLVGRNSTSVAVPYLGAVDEHDNATLVGVVAGDVDWRRTDASDVLGTLPTPTGIEQFVALISKDSAIMPIARISGTNQLVGLAVNNQSSFALQLLISADLVLISPSGASQVVAEDPPAAGSEYALLECDMPCSAARVFLNPAKNLWNFGFGGSSIVFGSLDAPNILLDGGEAVPPESGTPKFVVSGVEPHGWSIGAAIQSGDGDAALANVALGLSITGAFAVAGNVTAGAVQIGSRPAWTVPQGSAFLTYLNSEAGGVCSDR